jgi:sulfide:quinone oxidoreductase
VPRGPDGFIATDLQCKVNGLDAVYAAGDATWFPVKQGGIAAQQADVVAAAIAAQAGAEVPLRGFRPVLRGALLTGDGVEYLRRPREGRAEASDDALWWPPAKIAGRYLGPYLAGDGAVERPLEDLPHGQLGAEQSALVLAFEAADAESAWGDLGSALRWLDVAERLAIALPEEYALKRARWRDAVADLSIARP